MNESYLSLESLLKDLPPTQAISFDKQELSNSLAKIDELKKRFDLFTFDNLAHIHNENEATRFVHEAQWNINSLLDKILAYKSFHNLPERVDSFYEQIGSKLTDALNLIVKRFKTFFNPSTPLPYAYCIMAGKEIHHNLERLQSVFKKTRVDKKLLHIVIKPMQDRAGDPAGITYRELDYYRVLIENLLLLIDEPKFESYMLYDYQVIASQLKEATITDHRINILLNILLLHLNFNAPDYISFCIASLQKKLTLLPTDADRIKQLRLYIKFMNQVIIKPNCALLPDAANTTNKQIRKWIEEEIIYLSSNVTIDTHATQQERIDTSLSSPEMAVLIHLFIEGGLITDSNKAKITRVFSKSFNTTGSDKLSPNGLRSRTNNLKESAKEKVKNTIWNFFNITRKWS